MPLADQFLEAAAGARTTAALDETARKLWRGLAEGLVDDAGAEAISTAIDGRRATLAGCGSEGAMPQSGRHGTARPARPGAARLGLVGQGQAGPGVAWLARKGSGRPGPFVLRPRREKVFGLGRPVPLDREEKIRLMHFARCLSRRTEKGRAYGKLTAKFVEVLRALLWTFHNSRSGACFPSYERIAEAAGCARSTVAEAIKALEDAGVLSWVQRIKRVRERCSDLLGDNGWRWRVLRTSNSYAFPDPSPAADRPNSSKSEKPTGTPNQDYFSSLRVASGDERTGRSGRKEALREEAGANVRA